ncbi:MAG: CDP-alcohol phosphatidyltransferase family protein [Actinobacteria bacterium]|nr:MAG: CDP-alcohol phosphatidyltransferase family protein [Actinomycetota bacterium]
MGLADQLTIARAGAVPIVAALYISSFHWHDYWATGLFCLAMSTDWFDGRIARSRGRTSELGSLLDPVADKLLVLTVLIVLIGRGVFSRLDGGGDRRPRAPRLWPPRRRAWSDSIAWWTLLVALVLTWISGLDYARVAPGLLRGRAVA